MALQRITKHEALTIEYRGVAQPPARFFGQQHRSAAGGGCSEVLLAQRSKSFAAPRRKRFRAPQEGEQSSASFFVLITIHEPLTIEYRGVAQLVARLLWEQDAGCSSHLTPTKRKDAFAASFYLLFFLAFTMRNVGLTYSFLNPFPACNIRQQSFHCRLFQQFVKALFAVTDFCVVFKKPFIVINILLHYAHPISFHATSRHKNRSNL